MTSSQAPKPCTACDTSPVSVLDDIGLEDEVFTVAIIGGGPHALAALAALHDGPSAFEKVGTVCVIDPNSHFMESWNSRFDALEITHLRSPAFAKEGGKRLEEGSAERARRGAPGDVRKNLVLRGHGLWEPSRCRPGVPPGRGPGRTRTPTGTGRLVPIGTRDAASGSPGRHPDADRDARTIWPSGLRFA